MARESNLSSYSDEQKNALIADFNSGDMEARTILAESHGYASEKSLRNSMVSQWGRNIFSRNTPAKEQTLESIKARSVPIKFSSLWANMSTFIQDMPKSILADNGEIAVIACKWLQEALESDKKNPFVVSIEAWPQTELESILLLLSVESKAMKEARLSREKSEKEADRKRVEVLESRGYIVIGGDDSKITRMIEHHSNITKEIDGEVKRLSGKPDIETVHDVRRKLAVVGNGHVNMSASFDKLQKSYCAASAALAADIKRLEEYGKKFLQTDEILQSAMEKIGKLLPQEPKQKALTDVQQAAIAAMVAAGMTDAQARTALGV